MKRCVMVIVVLAACGAPRPAAVVPAEPPAALAERPAAAPAASEPAAAPALDEAAVKEKSHAFLDAYDRADLEAFDALLGPAFTDYGLARYTDKAMLDGALEARIEQHAPVRTHELSEEKVIAAGNTALYFARVAGHMPAFGDRPAIDRDEYDTLVWVRDGDHWGVALWTSQRAGVEAERERWNDWLVTGSFNRKPNQTLVAAVKGKKPGTALDVSTGQGRNAVFLATQGWKATGIDIADVGLELAQQAAAKEHVKLETVRADNNTYEFGKAKWDLVTMIYCGADLKLVEKIKPSLRKGGLFVIEYFHKDSELAKSGAGGWDPDALAAAFKDGFTILRNETVEDNADWAGQRKTKLVRFVAQKK